jgi:hypothetical protein
LENGTGLVVPNSDGRYLSMSLEHAKFLRDNCRKNVLSFQHNLARLDNCSKVLNSTGWKFYQKLLNFKNSIKKVVNSS